jgi:hypothetical protein
MTIQLPNIRTEDLCSEVLADDDGLQVRLVGTAEADAMRPLNDLLRQLHGEAVRRGTRQVTVDVRELEFMNSSCFKALVTWVGLVEELEPAKQYQIRFLSDVKRHWQERSLGALACFATHLIRIES